MVPLPFTLQTFNPIIVMGGAARCDMMQASGGGWDSATLKIVLSLVGAGAVGFCVFILLEALLSGAHAANAGSCSFAFS